MYGGRGLPPGLRAPLGTQAPPWVLNSRLPPPIKWVAPLRVAMVHRAGDIAPAHVEALPTP